MVCYFYITILCFREQRVVKLQLQEDTAQRARQSHMHLSFLLLSNHSFRKLRVVKLQLQKVFFGDFWGLFVNVLGTFGDFWGTFLG